MSSTRVPRSVPGRLKTCTGCMRRLNTTNPATTACAATDSKVEFTDLRRVGSGENMPTLPPILTCLVFSVA